MKTMKTSSPKLPKSFLRIALVAPLAFWLIADLIGAQYAEQKPESVSRGNQTRKISQQQVPPLCAHKSSCSRRTSTTFGVSPERPACYCDQICALYDDCCPDAQFAEPLERRRELGAGRLRSRRRQWLCKNYDPSLVGGIYVRASCHSDWLQSQRTPASRATAELVRERCERGARQSAGSKPTLNLASGAPHSDPLGHLMPITDLTEQITYANSYCLRCNTLTSKSQQRRKLIYWSPLVSCNYNMDSDDRNALYDLIGSRKGSALAYSREHNKWFIRMPNQNGTQPNSGISLERVCSVTARAPASISQVVRECRPRTVDACPQLAITIAEQQRQSNQTNAQRDLARAQLECQFGHQALVYSQTRADLAYYNAACARCNLETQVGCEPRLGKQLDAPQFGIMSTQTVMPAVHMKKVQPSPGIAMAPGELLGPVEPPEEDSIDNGLGATAQRNLDQGAGSFSVLMDLYGGDPDEQVGSVHRCDDNERQVYDPFLLTCRDVICGFGHRFEDGDCVRLEEVLGGDSSNETTASPSANATVQEIGSRPLEVNGTATPGDKRLSSSAGSGGVQTQTNEKLVEVQPTPATTTSTTRLTTTTKAAATTSVETSSWSSLEQKQLAQRFERENSKQEAGAELSAGPISNSSELGHSEPEAAQSDAAASEINYNRDYLFGSLFGQLKQQANSLHLAGTHKSFAECAKILVQPELYRLFSLAELNSSSPEQLALGLDPNLWRRNNSRSIWALVAPYNLTLAPGQFEPVQLRQADGRHQLGLLLCSPFKSDLVDKFKPAMVYLTTCCLIVSITSLVLYLILYWLSTFDLRHLVVEMFQAGQMNVSPLKNSAINSHFRSSQASNETSYNAVRSQSLSSRGVACLAAALLAAYLWFVIGHNYYKHSTNTSSTSAGPSSCALIAAATYGSFLLAFNWMFLLSYDIWRTLRLATCQLRTPTMGSQTSRFLIYAACAALVAFLMVALALLADQLGLSLLECQESAGESAKITNCSLAWNQYEPIEHLVQAYRPKFGQRAGSCWFANRRSLAMFFGLPVTLIMLVNLLFFLHSSFMVIKTSSRSSRRLKPTNSNWSQSSEQTQVDFVQQNSLTTSSISSVQTIESSIFIQSAASSNSDDSQDDSLESPASTGIQSQIDEAARRLKEQRRLKQENARRGAPKLGQTSKQTSFNGSTASGSQISITANSLVNKCDQHLSNLGHLMSSLAKDYRLYCRLSTIMGLTWLAGLAASLVDQSETLWYLFVVLNSLQGLFIFVAFGLKRSRLTNVKILLLYVDHRLKQKLLKDRGRK